jgi:hypothetical protein
MRRQLMQWTTAAVVVCSMGVAQAELVSKWTFNGINTLAGDTALLDEWTGDAVGLDPTLTYKDATSAGRVTGGQADLTFNSGQNSGSVNDGVAPGIYLDLTDGTISDMAYNNNNPTSAISVEMWVTVSQNRGWARLWDFGKSNTANGSGDGSGSVYMIGTAESGRGNVNGTNNPFGASTRTNLTGNPEAWVPVPTAPQIPTLTPGREYHIVYTHDENDTQGGTNPDGTGRLYLDGVLVGTGPIAAGFNVNGPADLANPQLGDLVDTNNWFGRAQFGGDPLFDGRYNEIRLYNHALDQSEVALSQTAGAAASGLPEITIDRLTGAVSWVNPSNNPSAVTLTGYTLTSGVGSLNPSGLDPISPAASPSTTTVITETIASGGNISVGNSVSLGTAVTPSRFEDVVASVQLSNGTSTYALVKYVGNNGVPLSPLDLNTDGVIDEDDFLTFASFSYTDISALSDSQQALRGDLNNDDANNFADFQIFKQQFNALNGAGALEAIIAGGNVAVPEPSTLVMGAALACGVLGLRRRKK